VGRADWIEDVPARQVVERAERKSLPESESLRERRTPSSMKRATAKGGAKRGLEIHKLLEKIAWLSVGEIPRMELSGAGKLVEDILAIEEIHRFFEKPSESALLYREQSFEVILEGRWMTGVVDRLIVEDEHATVIDFKTDHVAHAEELRERYRPQMQAYAKAFTQLLGKEVDWVMISTKLKSVVTAEGDLTQGEFT